MSPTPGKTTFTLADLTALRRDVDAFLTKHGWTQRRFAEESDVAEGTFGPWLKDAYAGDNMKVAAKVQRFLNAHREQAAMAATIPTAPGWQETRIGREAIGALEHAQVFSDLVVIGLGPGLGKTASIAQFKATRPRVYSAAMAPSTRGVPNALIELLDALGDVEAKGTPQALSRRVQKKVGPGALIVIDEAQHLSQQAVDELRSIHDRTAVGMVFSGDESVFQLFDGTRRAAYAQFHSRIGLRLRRSRAYPEDADLLSRAAGVDDPAMLKLLREIASKPGALRGQMKTLMHAKRSAALLGEPLSTQLIRDSWASRTPDMSA